MLLKFHWKPSPWISSTLCTALFSFYHTIFHKVHDSSFPRSSGQWVLQPLSILLNYCNIIPPQKEQDYLHINTVTWTFPGLADQRWLIDKYFLCLWASPLMNILLPDNLLERNISSFSALFWGGLFKLCLLGIKLWYTHLINSLPIVNTRNHRLLCHFSTTKILFFRYRKWTLPLFSDYFFPVVESNKFM